mmetsp:Transcript_6156/g.13653  ORF Transcript_6156/g.13653 Transcript_6156/m.13653 type:complete len:177 (+) Transcript_6156:71-601(+)
MARHSSSRWQLCASLAELAGIRQLRYGLAAQQAPMSDCRGRHLLCTPAKWSFRSDLMIPQARRFSDDASRDAAFNEFLDEAAEFISQEGCVLLDVRTPEEFAEGHVEGSINIPVQELSGRVGEVPAGRPVAVYCAAGVRSKMAQSILYKSGFTDVEDVHSVQLMALIVDRMKQSTA